MAKPSDSLMKDYSYFHSQGKALTKEGQYTFESLINTGHVSTVKQIIAQEIPYFENQTALDAFLTNPVTTGILKKYDKVSLTQLKDPSTGYPSTAEQSWYLEDGGVWQKPIIIGSLAPNETTNFPSSVLDPILYRSDNTVVPPTLGVWWVEPFTGLIRFGEGYEPSKSSIYGTAIGTPKITCYVYTGKFLSDLLGEEVENREFVYESSVESTEHTIIHSLNTMNLQTDIFESNGNGGWFEIMANIEHLNNTTSKIYLSENVNIKVVLRKIG